MSRRRFSLITDADARALAPGSTVELEPRGLVTPLARETLQARRITVVTAGGDVDPALPDDLAPVATIARVAIGADADGCALKDALVAHLRRLGRAVTDVGAGLVEAGEAPDVAARVATLVARREADAGIVVDETGLLSAIAANKVRGVRAAMCSTAALAREARTRGGANVLALGTRLLTAHEAIEVVDAWMSTATTDARDLRRLLAVRRLEERF